MFFLYVNTILFLYCYTVHEKHCKMMDMINKKKKLKKSRSVVRRGNGEGGAYLSDIMIILNHFIYTIPKSIRNRIHSTK